MALGWPVMENGLAPGLPAAGEVSINNGITLIGTITRLVNPLGKAVTVLSQAANQ